MLRWKINILSALKSEGYNQTVIRRDNILNQSTLSTLRNNQTNLSLNTLDKLCRLLDCQPSDLIEYVPEQE